MERKQKFFLIAEFVLAFFMIELFLHFCFGAFGVAVPVIRKVKSGKSIVVPHFTNGLVDNDYKSQTCESSSCKIKKVGKLFLNGFLLKDLNFSYIKLKEYRVTAKSTLKAHPYIPYVQVHGTKNTHGEYSSLTDENGFFVFGDQDKSDLVVLTLGGSTTASPYPFYMSQKLQSLYQDKGVTVVNAGLAAYTTAEDLATFAFKGLSYNPDYVVLYQAYNDVFASCSNNFKGDYSHWRKTFDNNLLNNGKVFDKLPKVFDSSAIFSILRKVALRKPIMAYKSGIMGPTTEKAPNFFEEPFLGLESYKRNIMSIIGIARAHNVKVILMTQALQPNFDLEPVHNYALKMNDALREIARSNNDIYFYDFYTYIKPKIDTLMRRDGVHFDEDGYQVLGNYVAQAIHEIETK